MALHPPQLLLSPLSLERQDTPEVSQLFIKPIINGEILLALRRGEKQPLLKPRTLRLSLLGLRLGGWGEQGDQDQGPQDPVEDQGNQLSLELGLEAEQEAGAHLGSLLPVLLLGEVQVEQLRAEGLHLMSLPLGYGLGVRVALSPGQGALVHRVVAPGLGLHLPPGHPHLDDVTDVGPTILMGAACMGSFPPLRGCVLAKKVIIMRPFV